jgi:hypothetical protein
MTRKRLTSTPSRPAKTYDVGHAKPPAHSKFKPGKSGNPKGRPKGAKNKPSRDAIAEIIEEEGSRMIEVKERGELKKMPTTRAIARSINMNALSGKTGAQRLAMELAMNVENKRNAEAEEMFFGMLKYANECRSEMQLRIRRNLPTLKYSPHPDDLHFDVETRTVSLNELAQDQATLFRTSLALKAEFEAQLIEVLDFACERDEGYWEDVRSIVRQLKTVCASIGMPWAETATHVDLANVKMLTEKVLGKKVAK